MRRLLEQLKIGTKIAVAATSIGLLAYSLVGLSDVSALSTRMAGTSMPRLVAALEIGRAVSVAAVQEKMLLIEATAAGRQQRM
ncbi:hypothetical protein [Muricoccus aerilatus]|uniref:hypothetical protein n=1 Tax=Muricoccus aerilatus TaxID=452982 RepID=UPI0005C19A65|nr:hypothetical protein [Roseomonas aerilata]